MAGGSFCSRCGKPLKVGELYCDCGGAVNADSSPEGSSLAYGTRSTSGLCALLVVLSVLALAAAAVWAGIGVDGTVSIVLACVAIVLALLARVAQAGRQHAEMMDEVRRQGGPGDGR